MLLSVLTFFYIREQNNFFIKEIFVDFPLAVHWLPSTFLVLVSSRMNGNSVCTAVDIMLSFVANLGKMKKKKAKNANISWKFIQKSNSNWKHKLEWRKKKVTRKSNKVLFCQHDKVARQYILYVYIPQGVKEWYEQKKL